jgi:hypothetical protein
MNDFVIEDVKIINKGALLASFSIVFIFNGIKVKDCLFFRKESRQWFSFPSKKVNSNGTDHFVPLVVVPDKNKYENLQSQVVDSIIPYLSEEKLEKIKAPHLSANIIPSDPSSDWADELPF